CPTGRAARCRPRGRAARRRGPAWGAATARSASATSAWSWAATWSRLWTAAAWRIRTRSTPTWRTTSGWATLSGWTTCARGGAPRSSCAWASGLDERGLDEPWMNVAWTGHRPEYFADPAAVAREGGAIAQRLRAEHRPALVVHRGGQRGVDPWAADAAERLGVPLHLYLPLPVARFAADWTPADRAALEGSWAYAAERLVVDPEGALGAAAYRE